MEITEKEIAAIEQALKDGNAEILKHGSYQAYNIVPKYGAKEISDKDMVIVIKKGRKQWKLQESSMCHLWALT